MSADRIDQAAHTGQADQDDPQRLRPHATVRVADEIVTIHVHGQVLRDAHDGGAAPSTIELPVGFAVLGRRHLHNDPPLPEQLTNAIGEVLDHLDDAKREMPALLEARRVFLEGVVPSAVAAVELGAAVESPEFVLSRDAAEDVFRTLATESHEDRQHNPGLPFDLVPVIIGGCCLIVALLRGLHLDHVTVMTPTSGRTG